MSEIVSRFEAAVDILIGDGPVKQRLVRAYCEQLEDVGTEFLPTEAGETFRALQSALHAVPPVGLESRVQASVQKMSPAQATEHARVILNLHRTLLPGKRGDYLKVVDAAPQTDTLPPPFLVGNRS